MKTFVMMSGVARSGKSTWVAQQKELFEKEGKSVTVCSSDAIREEKGIVKYDLKLNDEVFQTMFERAVEGLKNSDVVFYDATCLNDGKRNRTIETIRKSAEVSFKILHVFILTDIETLTARSLEYDFPFEIILRQLKGFQSLGAVACEELYSTKNRDVEFVYTGKASSQEYSDFLISQAKTMNQNDPHNKQTLHKHSSLLVENLQRTKDISGVLSFDLEVVAMFHDLGKIYTGRVNPDGTSSYPGHAGVSTYIFLTFVALGFSEGGISKTNIMYELSVATMIQEHMNINFVETTKTLIKLSKRLASTDLVEDLLLFSLLDKLSQN